MKVVHNGRGISVELNEFEMVQLKELVQDHCCAHVTTAPRWMWQLDAAVVAKQNDNRRQATSDEVRSRSSDTPS